LDEVTAHSTGGDKVQSAAGRGPMSIGDFRVFLVNGEG
jgi:hypothetical protein